MAERIWTCKIGGELPEGLAPGSDLPMRQAIERAYFDLTGVEARFTFSGWAGELTIEERRVA